MIALYTETRDRLFTFKRPGITYDEIINSAFDALEEQQKNNSPAGLDMQHANSNE